jgi:hypothetical protein
VAYDLAAFAVFLTYKPAASPVVDLVVLLLVVLCGWALGNRRSATR